MYTCIHVFTCTYIYVRMNTLNAHSSMDIGNSLRTGPSIYIYIYKCIYLSLYIYTYTYVCVYIRVYIYIHNIYLCIYKHTNCTHQYGYWQHPAYGTQHRYACINICIYIYIYIFMYTYLYMHVHIFMYIWTLNTHTSMNMGDSLPTGHSKYIHV